MHLLPVTIEEFIKSVGENYTRVANDIINGTTSELTAPIKETTVTNTETIASNPVPETNNSAIDPRFTSLKDINPSKAQTLTKQLFYNFH